MLVGYIVAYVFMAILADFFTKKRLILFGAFASIAGIICSLIVKNIFTASCSLAVGSFGLQIVFIIGFNVIS